MEEIEGIKSIVEFCILLGTIILCVVVIINAVLRWLENGKKKVTRKKIVD